MLQKRHNFIGHQHVESGTREVFPDGAQGRRHQSRITQVAELDGQDLQEAAPVTDRNIGWQVCLGGMRETRFFSLAKQR
jgi:hypothetical protein